MKFFCLVARSSKKGNLVFGSGCTGFGSIGYQKKSYTGLIWRRAGLKNLSSVSSSLQKDGIFVLIIPQQPCLVAEHPDYSELRVTEAMDFPIWGVVTNVIHPL